MMNRPTVLILSSDPVFSRDLTEAWPAGGEIPEFVLLEEDHCRDLQRDTYDLAIADAANPDKYVILKRALAAAARPAIVVHGDHTAAVCRVHGHIVELQRTTQSWPAIPALLGREILRRVQAESRAAESNRRHSVASEKATLGRHMAEMVCSVKNAL